MIKENDSKDKSCLFQIGELLGQGQFGKVYRGRSKHYSNAVAVKIIKRSKFSRNCKLKQLLQREIEVLAQFKHPNVIQFHQLIVEKQDVRLIYQECQGGTLEDRITMTEQEILPILSQILQAMCQAEKRGIIHRDLKPANILFKNGRVKIADWGFSRLLEQGQTACSFIGSPAYMAPQILKGDQYSFKTDIWSLGVVLFQTLTGVCPWRASSVNTLYSQISKKSLKFPKSTNISSKMKKAISQMLSITPQRRPTCKQLKQRFFKKVDSSSSKNNHSQLTLQSIREEISEDVKIAGCVFFLQMVQWCRKQISNFEILLMFIKLIQKNLGRLKPELQKQQIYKVWDKQLRVVKQIKIKIQKKIQNSFLSFKDYSNRKQTKNIELELNPEGEWQILAKQSIKLAIQLLENSYKQAKQNQTKKQELLTQLNLLLDLVIFPQLPKQYLKDTFITYKSQLQSYSPKILLKLINQKLQLISKKYYN